MMLSGRRAACVGHMMCRGSSLISTSSITSYGGIMDPIELSVREGIALRKEKGKFFGYLMHKKNVWLGHLKSAVASAAIQKECPSFLPKIFPPVANDCLKAFHEANAKGCLSSLSVVATEEIAAQVRTQLKRKQRRRDVFQVVNFTNDTLILQMRAHKPKSGAGKGWGQVTVIFRYNCKPLNIESSGSVHEDNIKPRRSIAVLEVSFSDPAKRWRMAMLNETAAQDEKKGSAIPFT